MEKCDGWQQIKHTHIHTYIHTQVPVCVKYTSLGQRVAAETGRRRHAFHHLAYAGSTRSRRESRLHSTVGRVG